MFFRDFRVCIRDTNKSCACLKCFHTVYPLSGESLEAYKARVKVAQAHNAKYT